MARVLLVGLATMDVVLSLDALPQEAAKYRAKSAAVVGGGCAANAAVAVARLGGEAWLAARLGDDAFGDMIAGDLAGEGVEMALTDRAAGGRSPFSSVLVDAFGERQIVNFRGEGLTEETGRISRAAGFDAVLADTRWTAGAAAALKLARERGAPGVLDAEAPIDPELLQLASHVAFSAPGLRSMSTATRLPDALAEAAAKLDAWACVTDGGAGVWRAVDGEVAHVPAFEVAVADTLGAGDIWHGAFALRLAEGAGEANAIAFANAAAALKCTQFGGRRGCPDRAATETFLKENRRCG